MSGPLRIAIDAGDIIARVRAEIEEVIGIIQRPSDRPPSNPKAEPAPEPSAELILKSGSALTTA